MKTSEPRQNHRRESERGPHPLQGAAVAPTIPNSTEAGTASANHTSFGFTLVETLVAITVFVVIVGMVLVFLGNAHRTLETESGSLQTQQAARVATDELSRNIQQIGYGILRPDPSNAGEWQRDVIYAGAHALAFNADIDSAVGGISPSTTLTFPDGSTYTGEGASAWTGGAETYVYTIDANGDGTITTADRTAAATGSSNPAAETDNPLDYALFRRVYGYNGSNYGGTLVPVTAGLFTNATTSDLYGDGTSPNPLFSYWLTEDLDGDNILDDSECVVLPCPPSSTRTPQLYLWGDTDFDGQLSESEKSALRTLPVGSPAWSKNRLATSGAYYSTTLSNAFDPAAGSSTLKVASAANFGVGEFVQVGSGSNAETFVVASTDSSASPQQVSLGKIPSKTHAAGETVVILPRTLLRAIRTVQVSFDAITPKKDYDNALGAAAVGRAGRAGTRGLEYRVRPFERKLELINLQTGAIKSTSATSPTCPTTFTASCSGGTITTIDVLAPRTTTVPVVFLLKDGDNSPMQGKSVTFVNSNPAVGTLSSATAITDSSGLATIQYTPTGTNGIDTITASNACVDNSLANTTMNSTLITNVYKVEATQTGNDCLQTYRSGYSAPSSAFTVKVKNPAGTYVNNYPLSLGLAFDTAYLPVSPNYAKYQGQLTVGGSPLGVTDSSSGSFSTSTTTGGAGTLSGSFALTNDVDGYGTRLVTTGTVADVACTKYGTATTVASSRFYKLALSSINPNANCTENTPCTIAAGADPLPSAKATLSINQVAATVGSPITLTQTDYYKPASTAASLMNPGSGWTTDASGDASANVYNNNDASITMGTPLKTRIDATSTGEAAVCTSGNIASTSLRPEFWFQGPSFVGCDVDIQQAWLKKATANDKICIDVKNADPTGGCDVSIIGMQFATYKADNVTLDSTKFKLQKLNGGDNVTTTGTCSLTNGKQLFIKDCNGTNDLTNNTRWDFLNYTTKCYTPAAPPSPVGPQEYFVFNSADFSDNVVGANRRFVITVYFQCGGTCSGATQSKTFDLRTP